MGSASVRAFGQLETIARVRPVEGHSSRRAPASFELSCEAPWPTTSARSNSSRPPRAPRYLAARRRLPVCQTVIQMMLSGYRGHAVGSVAFAARARNL